MQSAYLIATSEGYLSLLNLTLQHGADVTPRTPSTAPASSGPPTGVTPTSPAG